MIRKENNFAYKEVVYDGTGKPKGNCDADLSPAVEERCSILLKRIGAKIAYLSDKKSILIGQKEKTPDGDGTP